MPGKRSNTNFRKPLTVKAISNHVRKGQSSSSNPSQRKFRLEAKSKSFGGFCGGVIGVSTGKGGLTEQNLERRDGVTESPKDSENAIDAFDARSIADSDGGRSANSAWTTSSTVTMNMLLGQWNPSSALHKEMLAVYSAATEVIKASHGQETDTEYFAVLMTTLESVDTDMSRTATAALLTIFANRVPAAILRKKFSWITTMCINLMQSYSNSMHIVLLRNLLSLLAACLRTLEVAVWNESSTMQVFSFMFPYITHAKPRLRKFAQKAICKVLMGGTAMSIQGAPPVVHPGTTAVTEFCIKLIQSSSATSLPVSTLHVFGFLKIALPLFAQPQVKVTCEAVLQVMAVGHPTVVRCGMLTLQGFFASKPPCTAMGPELNAQLTNALYDYQPRVHDARVLDVWLGMMQGAFMNLQRLSNDLFLSNLPKFVGLVVNCWLCEKTEIHYTVASVLTTMLQKYLQPCLVNLTALEVGAGNSGTVIACIKVIEHLHRALHYQFYAVWDQVLFVWAACFEVLGKLFYGCMAEPLRLMAEMHDEKSFTNNAVLERAIGSAIRAMGPKLVLEAVPLNITGLNDNQDFARSWMLPVLRDSIKGTKLAFFTSYFLPLAKVFRCKVEEPSHNAAILKTYEILEKQVWALLPGFCTDPTDILESFSKIAKTLGDYLNSYPDLRLVIMSALRLLINTSATDAESTAELCKYSKNFLPILFNIYTTESTGPESESVRQAAYDTIKVFVRVSDNVLCSALFLRASAKLLVDGLTSFGRHAILDLARSLVSKMTPENVERLYRMAKVDIENSDRTVQKKAYRVLEELCRCTTPACRSFLDANLNELQHILLDTLSTTTPGSRAPRLRCLVLLLDNLTAEHQGFALTALCEAVLCVKANAAKVRQAAYEVVLGVGKALVRWHPYDQSGALKELISQLTAGFTGGSYLVSCTILALSTVLYEFRGQYSTEVLNSIIEAVEIVMSSYSREIVQAALYFVRMLFVILDPQELSVHLQQLVSRLCSLSGDCQKHFRIKVRNIFAKLIRKYGYENIVGLLPETHRKLVSNIRKLEERKKRNRQARAGEQDSSDEEMDKDIVPARSGTEGIEKILQDSSDDEEPLQEVGQRKPRRAARRVTPAWIEETGENDIVDFLDASAGRRITSTDPKAAPKSQNKYSFEVSEDGRLLIVDPESAKSKRKEDPSSEAEVVADDLLEALSHYKQSKKRKQSLDVDAGEGPSGMAKGAGSNPSKRMKAADARNACGDSNMRHLEPYAYVPMNRTALNKRFKRKPQAFKNLIRAAQKGARKGHKKAGRMKM